MKTVLFVCSGNTCRSPMAEYLFNHLAKPEAGWRAQSAGLATVDGWPISDGSLLALREKGIEGRAHRSRLLTPAMVDAAGLVVVMTSAHLRGVMRFKPATPDKVRTLLSFRAGSRPDADVPDPIGGSLVEYRRMREMIEQAVLDLILALHEKAETI